MRLTFCAACGQTAGLRHHQLVPPGYGGSDDEKNLITLCRWCLRLMPKRKGGWTSGSPASKQKADALAERMQPLMTEFISLSANVTVFVPATQSHRNEDK